METDYMNFVDIKNIEKKQKTPVEVTIKVKTNGKMLPMFVKWKNGSIYEIEKIIDIKPKGMHKAIYKVMINGKITKLYFNEDIWLVDSKG